MSVWKELRRRNVFRVAAVYIIVAWVITQVVTAISEPLQLPDWFDTSVILLLGIGLPIAMVLAWAHETGPRIAAHESVLIDDDSAGNTARIDNPQRSMTLFVHSAVTCALALAVLFLVAQNFSPVDGPIETMAPESSQLPGNEFTATNTLAVLPFENLSPEADVSDFVTGMQIELIRRLGAVSGLRVVDPKSTRTPFDPLESARHRGHLLSASTLLETTVSVAGEHIAIQSYLIDVNTGERLWGGRFACETAQLATLEVEIIRQITDTLGGEISQATLTWLRRPITRSPVAREMFLRAESAFADLRETEGLEFLNRALTADPDFAAAYALKAEHYARAAVGERRIGEIEEGTPAHDLALAYANRALEIDMDAGRAWLARAIVFEKFWLWDKAGQAYDKAANLKSADLSHYARFLLHSGRKEEAVSFARNHAQRNPLFADAHSTLAYLLSQSSDPKESSEAITTIERALTLAPENADNHMLDAFIRISAMQADEADASLRTLEQLLEETRRPRFLPRLIYAYSLLGQSDDVVRLHNELLSRPDAVIDSASRALIQLAFGNQNEAVDALASAIDQVEHYRAEPDADALLMIGENSPNLPALTARDIEALRIKLNELLLRRTQTNENLG